MKSILEKITGKAKSTPERAYNCVGSFLISGDENRRLVFTREAKGSIWLEVLPHNDFTVPEPGQLYGRVKLRQRDVSDLIKYLQGGE